MKVGILTFHRAINYGAVLQAWALQTFLRNKGYDAYVIDYHCEKIENNYKVFSWQKLFESKPLPAIKYILSHLYHQSEIRRRKEIFDKFIDNHFHLINTDKVEDLDAVISGSDQVWNPYLTGGMDNYYFLNIPEVFNKKRIAYAVSGEKTYFSDAYVKKISPVVESFDCISLRESNLKDILKLDKAEVCVDPTFLLTNQEWESLGKERLLSKEYIFLFEVVPSAKSKAIANKLSSKYGLEVVSLNSGYRFLKKSTNIDVTIGPDEFVSLIRYARFIVTTSFHGMAISMLLMKQFVLAPTPNMNRQRSLLETLGMESRIIENINDIERIEEIKYNDDVFALLAKASQNFLISSLNYDKSKEDSKIY